MAAKILEASGVLYTDRRDFYIDPQVVKELWTDVAPFTTVLSNKETRATNDPIFKMFEHRNPWVKQQCTVDGDIAALADGNTLSAECAVDAIVGMNSEVDDSWLGLLFEVWDSTLTTNRGNIVVSTVESTSSFKFKNMTGSSIDVADNDILIVVGNAHGEGTEAPEAWADELKTVWNSCQIFKTPLEITGTLLQASLRGESSELARLRSQKNQEHKMQKEKAFLFGTRVGGTNLDPNDADTFADGGRTDSGSKLIRSCYGMVSAVNEYGNTSGDDQNVFSVTGSTYSYSDFVDDMEKVFQYIPESGVKRAFVGAGALGYWSKMAGNSGMAGSSGWTVNVGDMKRDSLGFNYRTLETPHGMLQLIPTPALRGPYNGYMMIVSEENLFHAQYRSPMFQANIKTENAYDGVKDQYFSDEGVGISLIESHHLFKIA